jgi:hypothetical protein
MTGRRLLGSLDRVPRRTGRYGAVVVGVLREMESG